VKSTPVTVPTVALPTDSVPLGWRLIPGGSGIPPGSTPNVPPNATPFGRVAARLKLDALPTMNVGTLGAQMPAVDAVVGGGGAGGVEGVDVEGVVLSSPTGTEM